MASISDKARFHLEQTVPELREWERREIFTADEIRNIAKQRSTFEHILAGRGSSPANYTQYASFENNVAALVRKRAKRKNAKITPHTGQKRIFNIFERGTRKWHGHLPLWTQYLEFCRSQNSNKRLQRVMTEVLRLFPTKDAVWIWAAKWYFEVPSDVQNARGTLQRGLRFCPSSWDLHLEYASLEMRYLAKLAARRRILGIDVDRQDPPNEPEAESSAANLNMISLPDVNTSESDSLIAPPTDVAVGGAKPNTNDSSVLAAAIPIAIFDSAMKQSGFNVALAAKFFDTFAAYRIASARKPMEHVLETMEAKAPNAIETLVCSCRFPLAGVLLNSPEFLPGLRQCLRAFNLILYESDAVEQAEISTQLIKWLRQLCSDVEAYPDILDVVKAILSRIASA